MREHGVQVDTLRAVDHDIATGVCRHDRNTVKRPTNGPPCIGVPSMRNILVLCGPIWLGDAR